MRSPPAESRAAFEAPDLRIEPCRNYTRGAALALTVLAGDVLYIPPFWWHTVETLSPSLSLSTLSRWPQLYIHLNAVYKHEYFFDALLYHHARVYGLRAFLAQLVRKARATDLISQLVRKYAGFEHIVSDDAQRSWRCAIDERGTPTCRWCLSRINFDVSIAWDEHFTKLPADVRSVALTEFVEEVTAQAVGSGAVVPFWRGCFGDEAPPFFLTAGDTAEHEWLWKTR